MPIGRGLNRPLRAWQHDALQQWEANGRRGIVEAATGTGKTVVALAAIAGLDADDLRVAIVVPRIVLVDQWRAALRDYLGVQSRDVGTLGGAGAFGGQRVVIAVINSARAGLGPLVKRWKRERGRVLLIVDECHWSGSEMNSRIFDVACNFTLGLSATPERSDEGFDEVLVPALGDVVYRYPLKQALDDGVLAPLRCVDLYLDLDLDEQADYDEFSERIRQIRQSLESQYPELAYAGERWPIVLRRLATFDPQAEQLELLMFKRRRLVSSARGRQLCLEDLLGSGILEGRKAIVFHETIDTAEQTLIALRAHGFLTFVEHSQLRPREREAALESFRSSQAGVLVAVRTVDEGVDVPDADLAVIMSGTLTGRQRIQRIGRILRHSGGTAICFSLLARGTTEQTLVGARDEELLGGDRVRHHRWPRTSLAHGIEDGPSTYHPSGSATADPWPSDVDASSAPPPPPCPTCGRHPSGNYARCTNCGTVLDEEKARRQDEAPRPASGTPRGARGSYRQLSMADDPNFKRCPHCSKFIESTVTTCRFCHRGVT